MANIDVFKDAAIDEVKHKQSLQARVDEKEGNLIPKGVVSSRKLYDLQNHFQGPRNNKTHISTMMYEKISLGTEHDLKFVSLGTCCTP